MISVALKDHAEETVFDVQVAIQASQNSWKAYSKILHHYPTRDDIHDIASRGEKLSDAISKKSFWWITLHLERF